jgi:2-(1,2-epoxy-1,2-dihydrophenyl)acetyl-CoA isomerase
MENLTLDIQNHVAVLTLNRPQTLNALTVDLLNDFNTALDDILKPKSAARCLLLTGGGRGFSSGADLAGGMASSGTTDPARLDVGRVLESHLNPLFERLMDLPIPFVTAVNGAAAGAGCSLAIAGDIVVAARSAYFLQAFVNIGLVPDMGSTWLLPRLVGKARAQAMMMLGERISADKAVDWGMIYEAVEDDQLMGRAHDIASQLAHGPTVAHGLMRRSLKFALDHSLSDQLRRERADQLIAGRTADFAEGVSAFISKRPAIFQGR